jgi:hypothetical protein
MKTVKMPSFLFLFLSNLQSLLSKSIPTPLIQGSLIQEYYPMTGCQSRSLSMMEMTLTYSTMFRCGLMRTLTTTTSTTIAITAIDCLQIIYSQNIIKEASIGNPCNLNSK